MKLGRFFGTTVFIHWTWFLAAYWLISSRENVYSDISWSIAEYVAGFVFVTLHEFGHVLACRSVGGRAERVLLWPFGGLAFVDPPPRPGACLWTTVAGPLVNVVLVPILYVFSSAAHPEPDALPTNLAVLANRLFYFNIIMIVFNLLPVYPMDGGRILQAVLWYVMGQAKSLAVAGVIGVCAAVAGALYAASERDWWLIAIAAFLGLGAWGGVLHARRMMVFEAAPKRDDLHCPHCGAAPPTGDYWQCEKCRQPSDLFAPGPCPEGGDHEPVQACPFCYRKSPPEAWREPGPATSS